MHQNARTRLILQLERIIASNCSTKDLKGGEKYRYPVHYEDKGKKYKTVGNGIARVDDESVRTMKYTFASHTLDIGNALEEILNFMEENCEFGPGCYYTDDETEDSDDPDDWTVFD